MTALGKLLPLFPDLAPVEPRIVLVEDEPDAAHHDIGYSPARPRPVSTVARCRKCNEEPVGGVLHGMGDRPERVYCARCVGAHNRSRSQRGRR